MVEANRENMVALATRVVDSMDIENLIETAGIFIINGYVMNPDSFHEDWENYMEDDDANDD